MATIKSFNLTATAESTRTCLSDKEFRALLALSKKGDNNARNQLLMANIGLIYKIAKEISVPNSCFEDLVNDGCTRFLEIINDYDPDIAALSTYVWPALNQYMKGNTLEYSSKVGVFIKSHEEAVDYLTDKLGRKPNDDEVSEAMGLSKLQLKNRFKAIRERSLLSLDSPCDSSDDSSATLKDSFLCASHDDASSEVIRQDTINCINLAWNRLPEDEQFVLKLRIRDENGKRLTLTDAAKLTGMCKATFSKRHDEAKSHFAEILEEYGIAA